jgi:hypothetical protein
MRLTPQRENARTLAALLGIEEEDAAERLHVRIGVTFNRANSADSELAEHVIAMLSRTVEWAGASDGRPCALEVVIGSSPRAKSTATAIWAGQVGPDFVIDDRPHTAQSLDHVPSPLRVMAACYVAAAAVRVALGPSFPIQATQPVVLRWSELFGPNLQVLREPLNVGECYLAGAGAVGNGFLYALRHLDLTGAMYVVDPKRVNSGGLNRCLLVHDDDIGHPKASRICQAVQSAFPNLRLIPKDMVLADARKERGSDFLIQRLIVAVDSRGARRSLQAELPKAVFDASTTDIREVVLHFNRQPSDLACLSCVYPLNERERKHEENVATALGLTLDDVRSKFCTPTTAAKICKLYPDASVDDLVGRAFDTVYKEFCGAGKLKADGGQQVLAPFSFVSVLAGALLAVEFVLRSAGKDDLTRFNYWRLSPWHSPVPALRQHRLRDPHCEFCSNPVFRRELARIYGEPEALRA